MSSSRSFSPGTTAGGAFANAEDVIRCALETLEAEENWTDEEPRALDAKIERALEQVTAVLSYLVFYEPESNSLQILGILDGKRNVSRMPVRPVGRI